MLIDLNKGKGRKFIAPVTDTNNGHHILITSYIPFFKKKDLKIEVFDLIQILHLHLLALHYVVTRTTGSTK